jgi:signal transduction histidine kinase
MIPYILVWIFIFELPIQQSQTDSLKMVIQQTSNDSIKASGLYNLSKLYYPYDQDTAILYAKEAKEISKKLNFQKMEANSLNVMGVSYLIKSDYEQALSAHFDALLIRETIQDTVGMIESTMNLGNIYYRLQNSAKAIVQYNKSLELAQLIQHERAMSLLYNNLGSYYMDRWTSFHEERDFQMALELLYNSKDIKEKLQDKRGLVNTLSQLGELHYESGEKQLGIQMMTKSLDYAEELNVTEGILSALGTLSNFHKNNNSIPQALNYASQAYELAISTKSNFQIAIAAGKMAELSAKSQDFKKAYEYLRVRESSNDSIFMESRQKIRSELEIQYESEKKELENQKLIKDKELAELSIKRKNELLWISIVAGILLLALAWYQRVINQKLRAAHSELEKVNATIQAQNEQIQQQSSDLTTSNLALTQANKFRDKLFSIISHDLRTPFASLNNSLDLWKAGVLSQEEMDYILSNIASDTLSASILLSNLLKWARSQMGSEQVVKTEISLTQLINENKNLFAKQLEDKNQNLENHIPDDYVLKTDEDRLNFILRNILSNAIKFTPEGGRIIVEIDPNQPKTILITDSGIGMSQVEINGLFNKKQYSTVGTNGEAGTGIGLMLCKDFADSIGARISVSSQPGRSTTFKVKF